MTDPELPMYATEVRFYREVLAISWELGSQLRRLGALVADATTDDGRALFLLTPEKIRAALAQVCLAKTREVKDQAAETVSLEPTGKHLKTSHVGRTSY